MNVAICDYGAGNTRAVERALERLGARPGVTREPELVAGADLAILPGVGSARAAMRELRRNGLDEALRARTGPTLGICLGLQLALEWSEEDGGVEGLGLLPGRAVRIREGRVPRIGWAPVAPLGREDEGEGGGETLPQNEQVTDCYNPGLKAYWFAHAYACETPAATAASEGLVAEARGGSFVGCQFHPERSGASGARWLERCLSRV